ncbi:TetR/AcrR family transcriptional regulator [Streptomyces sp. NPDC057474]|uniref:TetR/AcrR family transcriptional regulator n=1 Tax=Streptomyces sp. NPDC057474 TaxID=3346144 RepID=UPI0036C238B3
MSAPEPDVDAERTSRTRVPNRWGEGQQLRQEILDAAGRLLQQANSPDEVSLRGIARKAGITAGAVYSHFKDKADLMWTLLDSVYATLAEKMRDAQQAAPADDVWAGLRAAVDTYCRLATGAPHQYDLLFRIGPGLPPPESLPHHPIDGCRSSQGSAETARRCNTRSAVASSWPMRRAADQSG